MVTLYLYQLYEAVNQYKEIFKDLFMCLFMTNSSYEAFITCI